MAKLEVTQGYQEGLAFNLTPEKTAYIMGRNPANDVVLIDMNASRNHARITIEGGDTYYIEDLNSSNGTYLNGTRLTQRVPLIHNSEIRIGATIFKFLDSETIFNGTSPAQDAGGVAADDMGFSFVQMLDEEKGESMDLVIGVDEGIETTDQQKLVEDSDAYQQVVKKLKTLYTVSEDIGTVMELSDVLEKIMDSIFQVFPQIDRGFIMLEDPDTGEMIPEVIRKRDAKEGEQIKVAVSRTIIQTAFKEGKSILSSDAMGDDRFAQGLSIVNFEIRSMMCSPLIVGDEKLGVIHVDTQDQNKRFTADDLSLLQGIGRQAAISIKNAKLMGEIEEETLRRTSLQRFLSPDIAERVLSKEIDLKLGGDLKFGTIFFSDIIGFTRMSSSMGPEQVVAKINRYFNIMVDTIFKFTGTINKFGGDSIMAMWGLTSAENDYAPQISSVEASIDMQNALFDFNYALIDKGQKPIQMGIGLNTGEFIAGNVGSEKQMEYTVIGDAVNMASRIESKAARAQIYISDTTFERVKERVYALKMGPTHVKGKEEPIQIYSIRGFRDIEFNGKDFNRLSIPVSYTDSAGKKHNGLLNGIASAGKEVLLAAHFKEHLEESSTISVDLDIPEVADPGSLQITAKQVNVINPEKDVSFYSCIFTLIQSNDFFNDLVGGVIVEATVEIDKIKRE